MNNLVSIPILDFTDLLTCVSKNEIIDNEVFQKVATKFGDKLSQIGFVYVKNHGISQKLIDDAFTEANNFFHQPEDIKAKYGKKFDTVDSSIHGYTSRGQERLGVDKPSYEYKELFDFYGTNRFYPDDEVPNFQNALEKLENACKDLTTIFLRMFGHVMNLEDKDIFCKMNEGLFNSKNSNFSDFRIIHYPSLDENTELPAESVRCGTHTDYSFMTLLFQDAAGGLEVQCRDGAWISATPIPGTFLLNIGETLEIISGGYFPATPHRILIPEAEQFKCSERTSIAFFSFPDNEYDMTPLKKSDGNLFAEFEPFHSMKRALAKLHGTYY